MAGQTCRSSGVLTSDAIISTEQCLLVSIHVCEVAGAAAEMRIYDGTSASGTEIARIILAANQTIEFDMHGVLARNGLFFKEQSGQVACSVEFA